MISSNSDIVVGGKKEKTRVGSQVKICGTLERLLKIYTEKR